MSGKTSKSLKSKAIKIKGKDYVLVSDRIIYFNEQYPNGSIKTKVISDLKSKMVIVKAWVYPDRDNSKRVFTGYSQAIWGDGMVNKTSALENAETSAVGRALAMLGIGVIDSVASVDEMAKAGAFKKVSKPKGDVLGEKVPSESTATNKPTEAQLKLAGKLKIEVSDTMTKAELSKVITKKLAESKAVK